MALVTYVSGLESAAAGARSSSIRPTTPILNPARPRSRQPEPRGPPGPRRAPWTHRLETFFEARVKQLPHLARRMAGAPCASLPWSRWARSRTAWCRPRQDGVLLVGDAAGFYDPFTGEGIFTALRGAELAGARRPARPRRRRHVRPGPARVPRDRRAVFRDKERVTPAPQAVIRTVRSPTARPSPRAPASAPRPPPGRRRRFRAAASLLSGLLRGGLGAYGAALSRRRPLG